MVEMARNASEPFRPQNDHRRIRNTPPERSVPHRIVRPSQFPHLFSGLPREKRGKYGKWLAKSRSRSNSKRRIPLHWTTQSNSSNLSGECSAVRRLLRVWETDSREIRTGEADRERVDLIGCTKSQSKHVQFREFHAAVTRSCGEVRFGSGENGETSEENRIGGSVAGETRDYARTLLSFYRISKNRVCILFRNTRVWKNWKTSTTLYGAFTSLVMVRFWRSVSFWTERVS